MAKQAKTHRNWRRFRLTPQAAAKGNEFVQELLSSGVPLEIGERALAQLMVTQALAQNNGQKKATGQKLQITRDWVREIERQTKRKSECLIPLQPEPITAAAGA